METTQQSPEKSTQSLKDLFPGIMKKSGGMKLAMMGAGLQSLVRNLRSEDVWNDRTKVANHKQIYGEQYPAMSLEGEEEMHVGDDNRVIHQHLPAKGSTAGTLAKLALGAGLLATGAGIPVCGWLIADALKNQPAPASPTIPNSTDKDTLFDLELVK